MIEADRVHSTPPLNTSVSLSRRHMLAGLAILPAGAVAVPAAASAVGPDAELIALGKQFEPLVDAYYAAHRRWSAALAQAHAEHDAEFGHPADRDYEYPLEIRNAFADSCERSGADAAGEALHAIFKEMAPLANTINAASVTSVEGFAQRRWSHSGRSRH
jgi:hypothetical protein